MPPPIATALCVVFVIWLWKRDIQSNPGVSHALWIPIAWLLIIGSRFPSLWLGGGPSLSSPDAYLEGSALDRNVFLSLLLMGVAVLIKRRASIWQFCRENPWVAMFFLYTLISIIWSDYQVTAIKRWLKVAGHVTMALVVLTDPQPLRAMRSLFQRCAAILLPVSVLFIKYLPEYGRGYDRWTGAAFNVGITTNKNELGNLCLILGLFFVAMLMSRRDEDTTQGQNKGDLYVSVTYLVMVGWLLNIANSATSLACLAIGTGVMSLTRIKSFSRHFTATVLILGTVLAVLQVSFNLKDVIIESLGRDTTLTGRTELWSILQKVPTNPLFGVGFESFWLGERAERIWEIYWWKPNQAHNGYYETYLNTGMIGLTLQIGMMLACYRRMQASLAAMQTPESKGVIDPVFVRFALAFLVALTLYNFTEATFKALHMSFFTFFLVTTAYSRRLEDSVGTLERPVQAAGGGHPPPNWRPAVAGRYEVRKPHRPVIAGSQR